MKKVILIGSMILAFSTMNVNAEVYRNTERDGILNKEETITIYDEEDVQDAFLEEDELTWWQRLIQDIFPKEETLTIL